MLEEFIYFFLCYFLVFIKQVNIIYIICAHSIQAAWTAGLTKNVTASIIAIAIAVVIVKRVVPIYKNYGYTIHFFLYKSPR